jgi:cobalamin biosynthetic protein CobC
MIGERDRIRHGGDLGEAARLFPTAPRPWIDLSTGINPVPYPVPPIPAAVFARLPSPSEIADLERTAAAAYGASDPGTVVAAPGTQALIELLPRLRPPGRVAVIAPTYAEHAHTWRKAGHAVAETTSLELARGVDVVVVVNPNNPDGRRWPEAALREAADGLARRGGWLVVDEAFADLEDDVDSLAADPPAGAIVLRSFGKTYGLAGTRLGFAIGPLATMELVRRALGPWAVSGPAIAIGKAALADREWKTSAASARAADARRLDDRMIAVGRVAGGTRLFRLYELAGAPQLFNHLGKYGIWVRRFENEPSRLRFGLPGSTSAWARLEAALAAFDRVSGGDAD